MPSSNQGIIEDSEVGLGPAIIIGLDDTDGRNGSRLDKWCDGSSPHVEY